MKPSSNDYCMLACDRDILSLQELNASLWRARNKQWVMSPHGKSSHVDWVKSIDVLVLIDGKKHLLGVNMVRQR